MAQIGGEDVAGVLSQAYGVAQGVEGVALDMIPGGRTMKGLGKNIALPAAAFTAAGALPGGHIATEAFTSAINAAAGLPAGALAEAISGTVGNALLESVGAIPLLGPKLAPAFAQAISTVIESGIATGAGALAAGAAPILGGQAMLGGGNQVMRAMLPGSDDRKEDARSIAAATQQRIRALQAATTSAAAMLPIDPRRGKYIAGTAANQLPPIRNRIDEAISMIPSGDRMSTEEGIQLANLKSQIAKQESKIETLLEALKRMAASPMGEMNKAVRGDEEIIDAQIITEVVEGTKALRALCPAPDKSIVSIKALEQQIKELGQEFTAQARAIAYIAKNDASPKKSIVASRELVDSAGMARGSIDSILGGVGDKATPQLRKVAGIARRQISMAEGKVSDLSTKLQLLKALPDL
jgi:hypothetical protein